MQYVKTHAAGPVIEMPKNEYLTLRTLWEICQRLSHDGYDYRLAKSAEGGIEMTKDPNDPVPAKDGGKSMRINCDNWPAINLEGTGPSREEDWDVELKPSFRQGTKPRYSTYLRSYHPSLCWTKQQMLRVREVIVNYIPAVKMAKTLRRGERFRAY